MAIGFDPTNPADDSIVSQFPSNERDSRAALVSAWAIEHDNVEGRHSFGIGNTATRDAITTWTTGAIWVNTSAGTGNTVMQTVVSVTASVPGWDDTGRFTSADEAKLDAVVSADAVTSAEAEAGTETGSRMWSPLLVRTAVSAFNSSAIATSAEAEAGTESEVRSWNPILIGTAIAALQTVDAATVGQGELKTTTEEISVAATSSYTTGAAGEYGFWPVQKSSSINARLRGLAPAFNTISVAPGTSYAHRIHIYAQIETYYSQQRYVQASPPYELGGIIIPTFIFAMIENGTGDILAMQQAPDPPWANNGPTDIRPQRVDLATGKRFKTVRTRKGLGNVNDPDFWTDTEIEITADYKNSDMGLIPHPFTGNDLTGRSIVMIDPRMKLTERLQEMLDSGESVLSLFHDGDIRIGNNDIPAVTRPNGVMVANATLR